MLRTAVAVVSGDGRRRQPARIAGALDLSAQQQPPAAGAPAAAAGSAAGRARTAGGGGEGRPRDGRRSGRRTERRLPTRIATGFQPDLRRHEHEELGRRIRRLVQTGRVEGGALSSARAPKPTRSSRTHSSSTAAASPADFELKVEFRINSTNSGVQYRSKQLQPNEATATRPASGCSKGYQADIDFANQFTGMLYEERGRGFLAPRGKLGYIAPEGSEGTVGAAREQPTSSRPTSRTGTGINSIVIARGNTLIHILNGHVTAVFVDDDVKNRSLEGLHRLPDSRWPADEGGVQESGDLS